MSTSTCRSCGAAIVWCETVNGKRMPVDAEPHAAGNLYLVQEPGRVLAVYCSASNEAVVRASRHRSHFVTCPNAGKHRRK